MDLSSIKILVNLAYIKDGVYSKRSNRNKYILKCNKTRLMRSRIRSTLLPIILFFPCHPLETWGRRVFHGFLYFNRILE